MKKRNSLILAAAVCLMLTGCKKKATLSVASENYASRDHVQDAYTQCASLAASIASQMDSGWTSVSPSSFGLPEIFRTGGYELLIDMDDLDGNGYYELTVGLQVDDEDRIYLFYTVTEEGDIQKVFVSSSDSFMVKEGAYYAVYAPEATWSGTAADEEETEEETAEETEEETADESGEEPSEDDPGYALWLHLQEVANSDPTATSEEAEGTISGDNSSGYLPAGSYIYENGVMTAQ